MSTVYTPSKYRCAVRFFPRRGCLRLQISNLYPATAPRPFFPRYASLRGPALVSARVRARVHVLFGCSRDYSVCVCAGLLNAALVKMPGRAGESDPERLKLYTRTRAYVYTSYANRRVLRGARERARDKAAAEFLFSFTYYTITLSRRLLAFRVLRSAESPILHLHFSKVSSPPPPR